MKHLVYILFLLVVASSCNSNTYSKELKKEQKLIDNYISRNKIQVVTEEPQVWYDNLYWQVPDYDYFYFHLVTSGDTASAEVKQGKDVLIRFKRYTLEEYADTLYNWTTADSPDPIKLQYLIDSEYSCVGWQLAIKYMKHKGAECKIICPSKLGFDEEKTSVTPYGYDLKITNIK
jgi:hypothetical protein